MPILYIQEKQRNKSLAYIDIEDKKRLNIYLNDQHDFVIKSSRHHLDQLLKFADDKTIYVVLEETISNYKALDAHLENALESNSSKQSFLRKPSLQKAMAYPGGKQFNSLDIQFHVEDSFQDYLFSLIRDLQLSDVEVYRRSNMDRKLFSKIRKENYTPSKKSVLALCIGLQLNLIQAEKLLMKVGYCFSDADKRDVIVQYCIIKKIYDILEVNEILYHYGQETL